jgi:hypothetical protein
MARGIRHFAEELDHLKQRLLVMGGLASSKHPTCGITLANARRRVTVEKVTRPVTSCVMDLGLG